MITQFLSDNPVIIYAILLLLLALLSGLIWRFLKRRKIGLQDRLRLAGHWKDVRDKFKTDSAAAVLEADKLLDIALGKLGKKGSLGEKLKQSENLFSDLNAVWKAHKLRNSLAHELNFSLESKDIGFIKRAFERAFRDLKII